MKIPLLTSLIFSVFATAAFASSAETDLKSLMQQTMEAYKNADADFLEHALAEEATIVNLDGTISSKSQDLSELAKKDISFSSFKMAEVKVKMLGEDHALVTGVSKGVGKYKGEKFDMSTRDAICFEKQDGKWRVIFWQSTEIKPADEEKE